MENLQQEVKDIKERNQRVEADKAWETSFTRTATITVMTYLLATLVMYIIDVSRPFLNALIPTLGYFLSFQSLPFIKKCWIERYRNKN